MQKRETYPEQDMDSLPGNGGKGGGSLWGGVPQSPGVWGYYGIFPGGAGCFGPAVQSFPSHPPYFECPEAPHIDPIWCMSPDTLPNGTKGYRRHLHGLEHVPSCPSSSSAERNQQY